MARDPVALSPIPVTRTAGRASAPTQEDLKSYPISNHADALDSLVRLFVTTMRSVPLIFYERHCIDSN